MNLFMKMIKKKKKSTDFVIACFFGCSKGLRAVSRTITWCFAITSRSLRATACKQQLTNDTIKRRLAQNTSSSSPHHPPWPVYHTAAGRTLESGWGDWGQWSSCDRLYAKGRSDLRLIGADGLAKIIVDWQVNTVSSPTVISYDRGHRIYSCQTIECLKSMMRL